MVNGDVSLVVCVSTDPVLRERVVHQLDGHGAVLFCADLEELRAVLWPAPASGAPTENAVSRISDPDAGQPGGVVRIGDLVVNTSGHHVTWRGAPLPLTRLERELLGRLASPPVELWTYQALFDAVWGGSYLGDTSILHSAMKRLRRKLRALGEAPAIETVRGVGYRLLAAA